MKNFEVPPEAVIALRTAKRVTVLTGAGVSAESGLPTFRDPLNGIWAHHRPEDLASREGFMRDPALIWRWTLERREAMALAAPNPAHYALVAIEQHMSEFTLITQNIDGLHHRAGTKRLVELHGNIARTRCFDEDTYVNHWDENQFPPRCPACGGLLRPDIVWFGELLPPVALADAQSAAKHCDLFFSIGTSGVVEPAASLAYRAMDRGATVILLNLDVQSQISRQLYKIHGKAGEVLPALVQAAWPEDGNEKKTREST